MASFIFLMLQIFPPEQALLSSYTTPRLSWHAQSNPDIKPSLGIVPSTSSEAPPSAWITAWPTFRRSGSHMCLDRNEKPSYACLDLPQVPASTTASGVWPWTTPFQWPWFTGMCGFWVSRVNANNLFLDLLNMSIFYTHWNARHCPIYCKFNYCHHPFKHQLRNTLAWKCHFRLCVCTNPYSTYHRVSHPLSPIASRSTWRKPYQPVFNQCSIALHQHCVTVIYVQGGNLPYFIKLCVYPPSTMYIHPRHQINDLQL